MKIYIMSTCCDDEYGCLSFYGAYRTREEAEKAMSDAGFQDKYDGERYDWRTDYAEIHEYELK